MEPQEQPKRVRIDGCDVSRRNDTQPGETWDILRGGARLGLVSIFQKYYLVALHTQGMDSPTLQRKAQRHVPGPVEDEERARILESAVGDLKHAV